MQLSLLTPPPPQARVYGTLAPKDRRRVQRMATSVKARVMAYFRAHPDARITAPQLGEILNLRVENCLAPRMSELAGEGWLQRTTELTDGARAWEDAGSARGAKWLYLLICWGTIHAAEWMSR